MPDLDNSSNSSFGEVAVWQKVSVYQGWIDQDLRIHNENPPATQATFEKYPTEGNTGTTIVYFWIQLNGYR